MAALRTSRLTGDSKGRQRKPDHIFSVQGAGHRDTTKVLGPDWHPMSRDAKIGTHPSGSSEFDARATEFVAQPPGLGAEPRCPRLGRPHSACLRR